MNLTTRSKWLTGVAAVIAGYVMFGPREPEPAEPARNAAAGSARVTHGATATVTPSIAHSLLRLAHRVVDPVAANSLFGAHSWYVPPPPPPPPPPSAPVVSLPPPAPTAPPLPYQYIGSYTPEGQAPVFFLSKGDRVFDVHVGDTLEGTYTVDGFDKSQLRLTYKPLNIQQQLLVGSTQ